jgi:two-component system, chemotaxis family, protein-glutamate methylesterase/glutaminase
VKSPGPLRTESKAADLRIVVAAASAGGLQAFIQLISVLPSNFPAAVVLIQHLPPTSVYKSQLRELLKPHSKLPIEWIGDGDEIRPGSVYLAPQDEQVTVTAGSKFATACVSPGLRPSADALFCSVADSFSDRAVGIVLTGALSDGANGADRISEEGGRVFAQDRASATAFGMPRATISTGAVDFVLSPTVMAHALIAFLMAPGAASWFRVHHATDETPRTLAPALWL